jgi:Ala-tRNA(Pro) deacylase
LENYLREKGVPFETQHHARAVTAQEVAATEHVPGKMFAKTVVGLAGEKLVMLVLPAPYHVNPEKAGETLGVGDFRLADEEQFQDAFPDCEVGRCHLSATSTAFPSTRMDLWPRTRRYSFGPAPTPIP